MQEEKSTIIHCHCRDAENKVKFFCDIEYRNGIDYILTAYTKEKIDIKEDCFVCYDGENNVYILNKLEYEPDPEKMYWEKRYYFKTLVHIPTQHFDYGINISKEHPLKFKKIFFTFPLINLFFFDIDHLSSNKLDTGEQALVYKKMNDFKSFNIGDFNINLNQGYSCGGGRFGGNNGHFDIFKSIIVSTDEYKPLNDYIEVIVKLIDFFSLCLRKKILISNIWSNSNDNTLNTKLNISTFQFYVINKEFNEENLNIYRTLATHALVKDNLSNIINRFFELMTDEYEVFRAFYDLYMRHLDAPTEILPQMTFLPLMQGLEAYISNLRCNKVPKLPKESSAALKEIKEKYKHIQRIDELKFNNSIAFSKEISNAIKDKDLEKIIEFKLTKEGDIKLIDEMVLVRNYYTHYSNRKRLKNIDISDAMDYARIICEIFIMKELNFKEEEIKTSIANNYYFLRNWDNTYCSLKDIYNIPEGFEDKTFIGNGIYGINKETGATYNYAIFYKLSEDKKTVELYAKNQVENGETKRLSLKANINSDEYNKLDPIFKKCYTNYLESEKQIAYRKKKQDEDNS